MSLFDRCGLSTLLDCHVLRVREGFPLSGIDWFLLIASLAGIAVYGVWQRNAQRDTDSYLLAGRELRWASVTLSIMATQASAITFLSTPGQAYVDGIRFVQFYFGLPIAMIILSMTAAPHYLQQRVYTAYEFLEKRLDLKTRSLAAFLFLLQRGLSAGLTIFAPSLILTVVLGWDIHITTALMGGLVIVYTTAGGARAVSRTQNQQMLIIFAGMLIAAWVIVRSFPDGVSVGDAMRLAARTGRLDAIDLSFDPSSRYTLWSGLIGGLFLALSYFGTDQSQVQRYLTAQSVTQSRLGLLANGIVKVPMQFLILLVGILVFAFYQFTPPPVFFNPVEVSRMRSSGDAEKFANAEERHADAAEARARAAREYVEARRSQSSAAIAAAETALQHEESAVRAVRGEAISLIRGNSSSSDTNDTNYIFLSFVVNHLPVGVIGIVLAVVFAAAMSSSSAELNALSSTTVVDIYRRLMRPDATDAQLVRVARWATVFWGLFAVGFAENATRLGSLVEAVNVLGSLFYGTILGIFAVAFFLRSATGTGTFAAAIVAEVVVLCCYFFTTISFLWYNALGCILVLVLAFASSGRKARRPA